MTPIKQAVASALIVGMLCAVVTFVANSISFHPVVTAGFIGAGAAGGAVYAAGRM